MTIRDIPAQATEYVGFKVDAADYDGTVIDPTGDVVKMAFVAYDAEPSSADWVTVSWLSTTAKVFGTEVGPNGKVLARGVWDVHGQVVDNPEQPIAKQTIRII